MAHRKVWALILSTNPALSSPVDCAVLPDCPTDKNSSPEYRGTVEYAAVRYLPYLSSGDAADTTGFVCGQISPAGPTLPGIISHFEPSGSAGRGGHCRLIGDDSVDGAGLREADFVFDPDSAPDIQCIEQSHVDHGLDTDAAGIQALELNPEYSASVHRWMALAAGAESRLARHPPFFLLTSFACHGTSLDRWLVGKVASNLERILIRFCHRHRAIGRRHLKTRCGYCNCLRLLTDPLHKLHRLHRQGKFQVLFDSPHPHNWLYLRRANNC